MKKLFSCMAVSALLLASCSSEEPIVSQSDGNVTFTATLPAGIQSRSVYDDGSNATTLMVAVYDDENNHIAALDQVYENIEGKSQKVNLSLVTGRTYTVVFWAQNPDVDYYTFDKENGTITVKTTGDANDTKRDAFFAFRNITVTGAINDVVKLTRPFAQVNIGTKDLAEFFDAKGSISTSGVTIAGQPNVLDLRDGSVSGNADYVFTPASIIDYNAETNVVDKTFPMESETKYSWLTANFILVPESRSTVEVTWTSDNAITDRQSITYSYVPVQRNYRTNIFGSLLTNPANFDVRIDENFDESSPLEKEIVVDEASFLKAFNDPTITTIELGDNVTLSQVVEVLPTSSTSKIDLAGHTLTLNQVNASQPEAPSLVVVQKSNFVISNGKIEGNAIIPIEFVYNGNYTLENVEINLNNDNARTTILAFGGNLTFKNVTLITKGSGLSLIDFPIRDQSGVKTGEIPTHFVAENCKFYQNSDCIPSEGVSDSPMIDIRNPYGPSLTNPGSITLKNCEISSYVGCINIVSDESLYIEGGTYANFLSPGSENMAIQRHLGSTLNAQSVIIKDAKFYTETFTFTMGTTESADAKSVKFENVLTKDAATPANALSFFYYHANNGWLCSSSYATECNEDATVTLPDGKTKKNITFNQKIEHHVFPQLK